ncbi:hypothetical protein N9811_02960 [Bacteroidia bacterium]|nr:hypothetical protein [Bacteroidia bacterium]
MIRKYLHDGIPTFFFNYDTGAPFTRCTFCDGKLDAYNKYIVEKHIRQNTVLHSREIVYEYALCWGCASNMGSEISDDSKQAIQQLFAAHGETLMRKVDYLHTTKQYTLDSWMERCSLTGKEIRLCSEFSASALVEDGNLVFEQTPLVVSDEFMEKMQGVLSKETKEGFDGLRDKIMDGSPSVEDLVYGPVPGLL